MVKIKYKRFEIGTGFRGEGKDGTLIYDNDGPDDYYFINDKEDLEKLVELMNEQDQEIKKQETQIRRLQNQINKLPPKIKEVWLE